MPSISPRSWIGWFAGHELSVLLALLASVLSIWAFIVLAGEVARGDAKHFDRTVLLATRTADDPHVPVGPARLPEVARDITALGSEIVLTLIVLAVAGFLLLNHDYYAMSLVLATTGGGFVLGTALKLAFARERPDVVPHLAIVSSYSFPSGHAMQSSIIYWTLAALLARLVDRVWLKVYLFVTATCLTLLVGSSRVYLGVHYPTDVLAGWSAGLAWASLCWLVARYLQRRGKLEQHIDTASG